MDSRMIPTHEITVGDWVSLKRPYRYISGGKEILLRLATVVEILNDGRCFGLKFVECPNVMDFGRSLLSGPVGNPFDIESHIESHQRCPRCAGLGEIPDHSTDDGGTRLCPGA